MKSNLGVNSAPTTKTRNDEWPPYLNESVLKTIREKLLFTKMTPVQSVVLPIFIQQHKDVVVEAITGSGKTLAFVIPIIEILLKRHKTDKFKKSDIGGLIITPTRELAKQIFDVLNIFLAELSTFSSLLLVGGNSITEDMKKFTNDGANIIVATVGRLEDLLNRPNSGAILKRNLKSLEILILDEADRLLDMGFKENLETIFKYLPKQRRTGLFSATQTDEIEKLIRAGLRNPCNIQVKQKGNQQKTPVGLHNYYTVCQPEYKFHLLLELLNSKKNLKSIVFMNTCACVQYFSKILKSMLKNSKVLALHRKIKDKRDKIFNEFKTMDSGVLLCTDILSRGIDIEDVDWVIQYDPPKMANSFVHRCGRTARSNREGNAIVILLPNEDSFVNFLALNQQVPLENYQIPQLKLDNYESTLQKVHKLALKERELYEKGKEAFVSYIKAYSNHECSHIFQIKELDLYKLGKGFGLLHMPKMPELRSDKYKNLAPFVDEDVSKIPYKNKLKEKERQDNHSQLKTSKFKAKAKTQSWSNNREKKLKKAIKLKKKLLNEKKRKNEFTEDDLKELEQDFRILKKIKKNRADENNDDIPLSD